MSIVIWCSSRFFVEAEQLPGPALVGVGVAGAGRGARHRLGPHDVADPRHQQLGRGADEPVDARSATTPGRASLSRRCSSAGSSGPVELRRELTGQHDLGEFAARRSAWWPRRPIAHQSSGGSTDRIDTDVGTAARSSSSRLRPVDVRRSTDGGPSAPSVARRAAPTGRRSVRGADCGRTAARRTPPGPTRLGLGRSRPRPRSALDVVQDVGHADRGGRATAPGRRCGGRRRVPQSCAPGRRERHQVDAPTGGPGSPSAVVGRAGRGQAHLGGPRVAVSSWAMPPDSSDRRTSVKPQSAISATSSSGGGR